MRISVGVGLKIARRLLGLDSTMDHEHVHHANHVRVPQSDCGRPSRCLLSLCVSLDGG